MPEYAHRCSNLIYTDRQKLAVLAFMAFCRIGYSSIRELLGMYPGFVGEIGLRSIPDGSTLCKFAKRISGGIIEGVIRMFSAAVNGPSTVIVDSTGLSDFERSAHFEKRCDDFGRKLVRTFTKLSLAADADTRIILSASASGGHWNDTTFLPGHVSDVADSGLKVD